VVELVLEGADSSIEETKGKPPNFKPLTLDERRRVTVPTQ
jgi:hypothetical protein